MKKTRYLHEESGSGDGHSPRCQEVPVTSELLIPVREVARLLGVSRRTVFLLLASGDLTRRKVGVER
jgi:excisionase family DNA binding protein